MLELDDEMGVKPSEYAISLIPIQNLLLKHGTIQGCKWLTYVFQMRDARSFYNGLAELNKHVQITVDIFGKETEIDETVNVVLEFYNQNETSTMKLLRAARESINNLQIWLTAVDTQSGDYDALKHINILEKMGKTVSSLKMLEEAAEKESDESSTRGGVEVNEFSR